MKHMANGIFVLCCAIAFGESYGTMQIQNHQEIARPTELSDYLVRSIESTLCDLLPNSATQGDLQYVLNVIEVFRNTSVRIGNAQRNVIDLMSDVHCRFNDPSRNRALADLIGTLERTSGRPVANLLNDLRTEIATITERDPQDVFRGPNIGARANLSRLFSSINSICYHIGELNEREGQIISNEDMLTYAGPVASDDFKNPLRMLISRDSYNRIEAMIANSQYKVVNHYEGYLSEYNRLHSQINPMSEFSFFQRLGAFFTGVSVASPREDQSSFLQDISSARINISNIIVGLQNDVAEILRATFGELTPQFASNASLRALAATLEVDISAVPDHILPDTAHGIDSSFQ